MNCVTRLLVCCALPWLLCVDVEAENPETTNSRPPERQDLQPIDTLRGALSGLDGLAFGMTEGMVRGKVAVPLLDGESEEMNSELMGRGDLLQSATFPIVPNETKPVQFVFRNGGLYGVCVGVGKVSPQEFLNMLELLGKHFNKKGLPAGDLEDYKQALSSFTEGRPHPRIFTTFDNDRVVVQLSWSDAASASVMELVIKKREDPAVTPPVVLDTPHITNSIGVELRLLPAGTFTMGDSEVDLIATPHRVTLTKPFYMGVHEVTNAQWKRVMGSVPSKWKVDDVPVELVSWEEVREFCGKLSALPEERKAGRVYRLPTEAEWEYACRAGTTTKYSFGDDERLFGDFGWFDGNSGDKAHPVGTKKPNPWGLYDMHGNVWEWCSDWIGNYPDGELTNPKGPSSGSYRVYRGGNWGSEAWRCRSAYRFRYDPSPRIISLGFRLALSPSGAESPEAGADQGTKIIAPPEGSTPTADNASVSTPASVAAALNLPEAIASTVGIKLKLIPAGTFTMGEVGSWNEKPHRVTLTKPFYMGVHEVTNAQWKQVMGSVPNEWEDNDVPVERVTWEEVTEFCRKLSALPEERKAGRVYRLPTEAEWEYACRAGTTTKYWFGDDEKLLGDYGWFDGNSNNQTHPVGQKKPNAWGLYDMHGNMREWCSDWYGNYPDGEVTNPKGPSSGSHRVDRGGCWYDSAWSCRSANRCEYDPSYRNSLPGFRLALSPSGAESPEVGK
jgi:formylglycine-generating enzyme required for sulfatase activity